MDKRVKWSDDRIIAEIRALAEDGEVPHAFAMQKLRGKDSQRLYYVAHRKYGSWEAACDAAGVNPVHPPHRWGMERVLKEIKEQAEKGPISTAEHANLYLASRRFFGSWNAALTEAGITEIKPEPLDDHKLKIIRKKVGMTQLQLANQAGITETTINKIERYKIIPRRKTKEKIAKALNIAVEEIFPEE